MSNIQLSKQDAEFVEEQMNSGLYESADAVVTAGLALLREQEEATLRELIQEGIDDVEAGVKRGRFTRAGGAGDEEDPVG